MTKFAPLTRVFWCATGAKLAHSVSYFWKGHNLNQYHNITCNTHYSKIKQKATMGVLLDPKLKKSKKHFLRGSQSADGR